MTSETVAEMMPLVEYIAWAVQGFWSDNFVSRQDLQQAGLVGLLEAEQHFDPAQGKFNSFAFCRIKGAMLDSLRGMDWGPRDVRRFGRRIKGRESEEDLHLRLDMELDTFQKLLRELSGLRLFSLSDDSQDGLGQTLGELIPSRDEYNPLSQLLRKEEIDLLRSGINELCGREREFMQLRYFEGKTGAEIARVWGRTESLVSQVQTSAIRNIKKSIGDRHANRGTTANRIGT